MALIHIDHKWLYLFEPHTASRVTRNLLRSIGGSEVGHHHIGVSELTSWRRSHVNKRHMLGIKIIATVRNPLDVLVTNWRFSPGKDIPFRKWVMENKDHPIVSTPMKGLWNDALFFCWYEDLEDDLKWMFNKLDDPTFKLDFDPGHVTEGKKPWWVYYDGEWRLLDFVLRRYNHFMKKFGYDFSYMGGRPFMFLDLDTRRRLCKKLL